MPRQLPVQGPEKPGKPWYKESIVRKLVNILKEVTMEVAPDAPSSSQSSCPAAPHHVVVQVDDNRPESPEKEEKRFNFPEYIPEPLQDKLKELDFKNEDLLTRMMAGQISGGQLKKEMAQHVEDLLVMPELDRVHGEHFADAYEKYAGALKRHESCREFGYRDKINEGADILPLDYRLATEEQWTELEAKKEAFRYVREGNAKKLNIYLGYICPLYKARQQSKDFEICPCLEKTLLPKASVIHMAVANHQYLFLQHLSGYVTENPHLQDLLRDWIGGARDMAALVDLALFRQRFDGEAEGTDGTDTIQTLIDPNFCYYKVNIGLFKGNIPWIAKNVVYSADYLQYKYEDNLLSLLIATHQWDLVTKFVQETGDNVTSGMIPQLLVEIAYCGDVVRARNFLKGALLDWTTMFFARNPQASNVELLFTGAIVKPRESEERGEGSRK